MVNSNLLPVGLDVNRVAAYIGLVSDTHMPQRLAALPVNLFTVLAGVDLLLHAGDVGELWVLIPPPSHPPRTDPTPAQLLAPSVLRPGR